MHNFALLLSTDPTAPPSAEQFAAETAASAGSHERVGAAICARDALVR